MRNTQDWKEPVPCSIEIKLSLAMCMAFFALLACPPQFIRHLFQYLLLSYCVVTDWLYTQIYKQFYVQANEVPCVSFEIKEAVNIPDLNISRYQNISYSAALVFGAQSTSIHQKISNFHCHYWLESFL